MGGRGSGGSRNGGGSASKTNNADWAKYIKVDNMPNADMAIIAETMGLEVAKKFLFELRGINFSVPFNISDYLF